MSGRQRIEGSEAAAGHHSDAGNDLMELWMAAVTFLLATAVLAEMRHNGAIDWTWIAVLAPTWAPLLTLVLVLVVALVGDLRHARQRRRA